MDGPNFITNLSPVSFWTFSTVFLILRYFLLAGLAFFLFYKLFKTRYISKKIQKHFPKSKQLSTEIKHSMITVLIFSGFALLIRFMRLQEWTAIYTDFELHSMGYFLASIGILIVLHDTYFYWIHCAMHRIPFLMKIHGTHHQSTNPTPFTSLSFHPVESILEIAFFPLVVLFLPVHPIALAIVGTLSLLFNVLGHSGYELLRPAFINRPVLRWLNTSTHHNMHHKKGNGNYGLYFNFWDTIMGTNFKTYKKEFDKNASKNSVLNSINNQF